MKRLMIVLFGVLGLAACEDGGLYGESASLNSSYVDQDYPLAE